MTVLGSLRVLPFAIFGAALMLSVKVGDLVGGLAVTPRLEVARATAQSTQTPPAGSAAATGNATPMQLDDAEESEEAAKLDEEVTPEGLTALEMDDEIDPEFDDIASLSAGEIRLLTELADRRRNLEVRERAIEERATLLRAAEERLSTQQDQLNEIKVEIQVLLERFEELESEETDKLVRFYSNMKPKNAAAIFNELDMETLVAVMRGMSERKLAPIIAAMNTERARLLTRELAERQALPELPN